MSKYFLPNKNLILKWVSLTFLVFWDGVSGVLVMSSVNVKYGIKNIKRMLNMEYINGIY